MEKEPALHPKSPLPFRELFMLKL